MNRRADLIPVDKLFGDSMMLHDLLDLRDVNVISNSSGSQWWTNITATSVSSANTSTVSLFAFYE